MHTYMYTCECGSLLVSTKGGKDAQYALSLHVISRKRALKLIALLRKEICNLRHPVHLCHPVILPPISCTSIYHSLRCIFIHVYMYMWRHMNIYAYKYIYVHNYFFYYFLYVYACMHMCVHIYVCICGAPLVLMTFSPIPCEHGYICIRMSLSAKELLIIGLFYGK